MLSSLKLYLFFILFSLFSFFQLLFGKSIVRTNSINERIPKIIKRPNIENITFTSGVIYSANGTLGNSENFQASDYFEIESGIRFSIPSFLTPFHIGLAFYDKDHKFIVGISFPYGEKNGESSFELGYFSHYRAKYMRVTKLKNEAFYFKIHEYSGEKDFKMYQIFGNSILNNNRDMTIFVNMGKGALLAHSGTGKTNNAPRALIYQSIDYGLSWKFIISLSELGVRRNPYYGDSNGDGTVMVGTADTGNSYHLLLITNYGSTRNDYKVIANIREKFDPNSNGCEVVKFIEGKTWRIFINNFNGSPNGCIWETNDNGETWHHLDSEKPLKTSIRSLKVMDDGSWWVSGMYDKQYNGIWVSYDKGLNWEQKTNWFAFSHIHKHNGILFAGMYDSTYQTTSIYRSQDNGNTWSSVIKDFLIPGTSVTYERDIFSIGETLVISLCEGEARNSIVCLFKFSNDNGITWQETKIVPAEQIKNAMWITNTVYFETTKLYIMSTGLGIYCF